MLVDSEVSHSVENTFMDTIFMFLHSIMFTLTLQISKLTKAVVEITIFLLYKVAEISSHGESS
jgi:hypothetical protein